MSAYTRLQLSAGGPVVATRAPVEPRCSQSTLNAIRKHKSTNFWRPFSGCDVGPANVPRAAATSPGPRVPTPKRHSGMAAAATPASAEAGLHDLDDLEDAGDIESLRVLLSAAGATPATWSGRGLYGLAGVRHPQDMWDLAARMLGLAGKLRGEVERSAEKNAAAEQEQGPQRQQALRGERERVLLLSRQHHMLVTWLRAPAQHCAAHHPGELWRQVAARVAERVQAADDRMCRLLAAHPLWPSHQLDSNPSTQQQRHENPALQQTVTQAQEAQVPAQQGAQPAAAANLAAQPHQEEADVAQLLRLVAMGVDKAEVLDQEGYVELRHLQQLEELLLERFRGQLADPWVAGSPLPLVVLHGSEVAGDELLRAHATPATPLEVEAALGAAGRGGEGEENRAGEGSRGGGGEGEGEAEQGMGRGGGKTDGGAGMEVDMAPLAAATYRARVRGGQLWSVRLTGPLAVQLLTSHPSIEVRRAVHCVTQGSQAAATLRLMDTLRPLRDDVADCYNQPSYAHWRTAGSVAGCPAAALSFLADLLAAVRGPADAEVQQLQRLAVHLHVEGEDGEGEQGLFAGRGPGAEARETEAGGAAPADPLELTGSVDYLSDLQRDPGLSAEEWGELAPFFTVRTLLEGLSRAVLSRVLSLELRPTALGQHEGWGQQPRAVTRWELRQAAAAPSIPAAAGAGGMRAGALPLSEAGAARSGATAGRRLRRSTPVGGKSGKEAQAAEGPGASAAPGAAAGAPAPGQLLGVCYVYLDPDCAMPFTQVVRYGFVNHSSWTTAAGGDNPAGSTSFQPPEQSFTALTELGKEKGHGEAWVPHVVLHLPASEVECAVEDEEEQEGEQGEMQGHTQQQREQQQHLLLSHAGMVRTLVHELGHVLHLILSSRPGSPPEACACHSSTDLLELPSHLLERWAADPHTLAQVARHALSGAPLPPRYCARVAAATRRQGTWLEVQQHALLAAADLLMHTNDAVHLASLRPMGHSTTTTTTTPATSPPQDTATTRSSLATSQHAASRPVASQDLRGDADAAGPGGSPPQCPPGVLHPPSTATEVLVGALWARHSSLPGGAFAPSRHTMSLLPGLLHNAGAMYAYPMAQIVAAAVWERYFSGGWDAPAAARGGALLRRELLERGEAAAGARAVEALLGRGSMRVVVEEEQGKGEGGDPAARLRGWVPDLAHEAFQGMDLLVF